jgi:hypothetical protein
VWLNESEFFHTGCQASNGLSFGQLAGGALTMTPVATALGQLALSADKSCLLEWSDAAIRVAAAEPDTYAPTTLDEGGVIWFPSFTATSSALVYVALGVSLQYYPLEACVPTGERLQRVASGIVTKTLLLQ